MEKRFILGCVAGLIAASSVATAAPQPTRTVILLDESGSMKKNDPDRLSLDAARLFTELGLDADQIAVVAFADRPRVLVPMSPARSPATKKAVRQSLNRLRFDGQTTDIESGLMAALDLLPPGNGTRDSVVVLTDGKVDLGPSADGAVRASLERMRVKLAPVFVERGVRAYTIAFTPQADQALMRGLARATKGEYRYLPHAAALAGAFAEMFTSAGDLETLPMRDGAFITDPNIGKTSLVLSKTSPGDANTLRTPNDVLVTKDSQEKGVEWTSGDAYDHVTLTNPQAGPWAVDTPPGAAPPVAMITESELEFVASVAPEAPIAGQPVLVRAELRRNGELTNAFELHDGLSVSVHVAPEEGKPTTVPLERVRDGGYEARVEGLGAGRVALYVRAQSANIEREKRILLDVAAKPPEPSAAATTVVEVKASAGVWPFVAGGILVLALAGFGLAFMMRSRWKAALAAVAEANAKPPPPPLVEYVDKAILLAAEDMQVLLPGGGATEENDTLDAVRSLEPEITELTKHQEAIQAAIDIVMNATVAVTTGLGGLGGSEGLPEEVAARRDALIEKMREVDDQVGTLCDGSMNLAEQIQKTSERLAVVLEEKPEPEEPILTHLEINEVILSRADEQTREEFERLRRELLDSKTQVVAPEIEAARAELEAKVAEMLELKTQFDDLTEKNGKLETQLSELTTEYQRIFNEVNG